MDSKVDTISFNQIAKAIENKADKFEVQTLNKGSDGEVGGKVHKLSSEFSEMDKKIEDVERTIQRMAKD